MAMLMKYEYEANESNVAETIVSQGCIMAGRRVLSKPVFETKVVATGMAFDFLYEYNQSLSNGSMIFILRRKCQH